MTDTDFIIPTDREEARRTGSKTFIGLKSCKRKHGLLKYVSNNGCVECQQVRSQKSQKRRLKRIAQQRREVKQGKRLKVDERIYGGTRERMQRIKQATPQWTNKREINEIYANRPDGHHVDHIVPLQGKNVCGLHIPENLQYLPALKNFRKGNRF